MESNLANMECLCPEDVEKFGALEGKILKCRKCPLCETRNQAVPGSGSACADVVFVGEGPGANEDKKGVPFVGAGREVSGRNAGAHPP